MVKNFLFTFLLLFTCSVLQASNGDLKKDTVQALVVSTNSNTPIEDLEELNGEEIISIIDSLLNLDTIPQDVIFQLKDYVEGKALSEDLYISLTGFNDKSIYPSNNAYKTWDTYNLYPYQESLRTKDKEIELILQDTLNFCNYIPPIKGLITSNYGWRDGRPHKGIDIDLHVWDPVVASFDGMVRIARNHNGYGRVVIIRHYNGLETLYAHLHRLKVKPGDIVEAGQVIGLGGSSGRSSGSHLHYELRYKGVALNPKSIIDFNNNALVSDSIKLIKTKYSYVAVPKGVEYYTVVKGDHLYGIAQRFGTTISSLCDLNGIRRNKPLSIGQKIRIGS